MSPSKSHAETKAFPNTPSANLPGIERRDISFDLSAVDLANWHPLGPHVSHYFNVQSLLFPKGERFFIRSVRRFQGQIHNPELQQQVKGFIGQEAMHGREHEEYNLELAKLGYRKDAVEAFLQVTFDWAERLLPAKFLLALTVSMEHLTAIAAEDTLKDDQALGEAPAAMKRLWLWHALEESEHKAVAFDVYSTVAGTGISAWLRRCVAMLSISINMQILIAIGVLRTSIRCGDLFDWRGWWQLFAYLWGRPGLFRRQIPRFLKYFSLRFHPWDIDNRQDIARWKPHFDQAIQS